MLTYRLDPLSNPNSPIYSNRLGWGVGERRCYPDFSVRAVVICKGELCCGVGGSLLIPGMADMCLYLLDTDVHSTTLFPTG